MATLRQNTKFYTTRADKAGGDVVGYIHRHPGWELDREYPMAMRLPTRNIVRFGSVMEQDGALRDPSLYEGLEDLMRDDGKNFQITYSFPLKTRVNVFAGQEYGAPGVTMRQLYDFLCEEYNGGERFVDSYFEYIFPSSPAGRVFGEFRSETARMVNAEYKKKKAADERVSRMKNRRGYNFTREWKALRDFQVWRDTAFIGRLDTLHKVIKREVAQYLSAGKIPLRFRPATETLEVRAKRGLLLPHGFYASGQLINSLRLSIRIPGSAFRLTEGYERAMEEVPV
jgi:hypothetical protein